MKKRFALYGMFAAMALFATACGDDSSSGPEEESSSSIEVEDVSSSSVEEEAPESSEESGDAKSSSSEAKKGDSSSSEKTTSSSSAVSSSSEITRSSDWDVNKLFCDVKVKGDSLTVKYGVGGVFEETVEQDASAPKVSITYEGSSCENIDDFDFIGSPNGIPGVSCEVSDCVAGNKWAKKTLVCTSEPSESDKLLFLEEEMEASLCNDYRGREITTDYLNKEMFDEGKYGVMLDTREYAIYRTIKIGDQTWMAQNLLYETESGSSCYGDPMPEGTINGNCLVYGRLYTWNAARSTCPTGWHLPTKEDFEKLVANVDSDFGGIPGLFDNDDKLKTESWGGGSNEIGFSAVPAGRYGGEYDAIGRVASFWGQTVDVGAIVMILLDDKSVFEQGNPDDYIQMSVRCVKD